MKKLIFALLMIVFGFPLSAQKTKSKAPVSEIKIQMTADRWESPANATEFLTHKGMPAIKILTNGDKVIPKDINFSDGTIEYDIEPGENRFNGINFRMADANESEFFYLRTGLAGNPVAQDAIQYAPIVKTVNLWDLLDHFQGPASIRNGEWNHIKLVISGKQMLVFVNDLARPALEIPRLEGNTMSGKIAFGGQSIIANVVIRPNVTEGLSPAEGFDPTYHDARYIRSWQITEPQPLPKGSELYGSNLFPSPSVTWQNINAERRGLINLTRLFGRSESRRFVWMRAKLTTTAEQKRKIALGFSDEVWVFLNGQLVFVDKNLYISPGMRKTPDGRISLENATFNLTLPPGENELLIGVANDFFGWGIIARLDDHEGVVVSTDFPPPVVQPKDLSPYLGVYTSPQMPEKITVTTKDDKLIVKAVGEPVALEYFDKDKFRYVEQGAVLEFYPSEKKMILKQGGQVLTFTKE